MQFVTTDPDAARYLADVPGVRVTDVVQHAYANKPPRFDLRFGLNAAPVVHAALRFVHEQDALDMLCVRNYDEPLFKSRWANAAGALRVAPEVDDWKTYQWPGVEKLVTNGCGLLRWPPGAGKSRAGIATALAFPGPRIIVTRASNRAGYIYELAKWTGNARAYVIQGIRHDDEDLPEDYDFYITGVETLQFNIARLLRLIPKTIVWDESDLVKSAQRWQSVPKKEGAGVDFVRRRNRAASAQDLALAATHNFATTATLFPNRPRDGYAQGDLIEPGKWGSWGAYARRYCARVPNAFGGFDDNGSAFADELRMRWAAITHEVPQSAVNAEMPPIRIVPAFIPKEGQPDAEELREALAEGTSQEQSGLMQAALRARPYVLDRMEETVRAGGKVAIFTGWRADAERMAKAVSRRLGVGVRRGRARKGAEGEDAGASATPVVLIHGGTGTSGGRIAEMEPFILAPGGAVLIGTIGALGRSLDGLQCVNLALFQMLPYTPGEFEQAIGRFPRLGRIVPCLIELCVPLGSYAEKVVTILLEKGRQVCAIASTEVLSALPGVLLNGAGVERAFANILAGPASDEPSDFARDERVHVDSPNDTSNALDAIHATALDEEL